ncbi:MAG: TonB-dependent receptor [Acidobacteria bacterium]|nr:TonB-dependent receptor [Acidobacteriota bacterium]
MAAHRKSIPYLIVGGGVCCLPLLAQQPAPAKEKDDEMALITLLNTPISSASKRVQDPIESPQAVEVITSEQIRMSGAFKLTDVLKLATSVQVWDNDPNKINVTIRGINPANSARSIQVLVDGVALYNIINLGVDWNGIPVPIDAIDRVEIVRGPSSSLYGANAQMGVIAISTKRGIANGGVSGSLRAAGADHHSGRGQAYLAYNSDAFQLTAAMGGGSNGDTDQKLPMIANPSLTFSQPNATHTSQLYLRPELSLGKDARIWAAYGRGEAGHFSEIGIAAPPPGAPFPPGYQPVLNFTDEWIRREIAQVGWSQAFGTAFRLEARADQKKFIWHVGPVASIPGSAFSTVVWNAGLGSDPGLVKGYDFFSETIRGGAIQANWDPMASLHFVVGVDSHSIKTDPNPTVGVQAQDLSASGGFISADWEMGAFIFSAGARAANESLGGSSTSPRASVVWKVDSSSALRAGWFTSQRSPQVQEKFAGVNNAVVAQVLIPNPGLDPEDVSTLELGYRHKWSRAILDVTVFKATVKKLISQYRTGNFVGPKPEVQFRNGPDSYEDTGVELSLTGEISPGLTMGVNLSTASFKDPLYDTGNQADYSPKQLANLWGKYQWGQFFFYGAVQHIGGYTLATPFGNAIARQDIDAQTLLHFNSGMEFFNGISVSVYGQNANKKDAPVSNGGLANQLIIRNVRREIGLQASYRF